MGWDVDVVRFGSTPVEESRVLEFKRELAIDKKAERAETLKDLTAMGNGGGGVVVFGVDEQRHPDGRVTSNRLCPLTDRSLQDRLHDIVRDAVFPPLLVEYTPVEVAGGYVLVVEVLASALGPYMVESYGEHRYYTRSGRSSHVMAEAQVRAAYTLALRSRDRRAEVWAEHGMPLRTSRSPWLSASLVPTEPLIARFIPSLVRSVTLPEQVRQVLRFSPLLAVHDRLGVFADGIFGYDGDHRDSATTAIRIHADGAVACGRQVVGSPDIATITRQMNDLLFYVSVITEWIGTPTTVEVELRLDKASQLAVGVIHPPAVIEQRALQQPVGMNVIDLSVNRESLPRNLSDAATRHQLVHAFHQHLCAGYGEPAGESMFNVGPLYNADGQPIDVAVAGYRMWSQQPRLDDIVLYTDGTLVIQHNNQLFAHLVDGALLTEDGDTIAVTELALGQGCPTGFTVAVDPNHQPPSVPDEPGAPFEPHAARSAPTPTRRWAGETFHDRLARPREVPMV